MFHGVNPHREWDDRIEAVSDKPGVSLFGDVTHTLVAGGCDASEDGTGRGTPIVWITL